MWFPIALGVAVSEAGKDIFFSQKKFAGLSALVKAWVVTTVSLPALAFVLYLRGVPTIEPRFWGLVSVHAVLLSVALVLYMQALALGPLSQTQPILGLTSVFLVITNQIMTDDVVTILDWVGVLMVAVGIYATQHPGANSERGKRWGFWAPLVEMFHQPGVREKLGVAVILSVTSNLDKLCTQASSGPFYVAVDWTLVSLMLGLVIVAWPKAKGTVQPKFSRDMILGGVINANTALLHVWALTLASVPAVIAVKRISIMLTSLWGYAVRGDRKANWYRLLGVGLVVGGVVTILLG